MTFQLLLDRLKLAWQVLLYGLPVVPFQAVQDLVATPRSAAVRRAVLKVLADPQSHPTATVSRDEALEWATTYETGSRQPWTWEHAFLLEYWVGVEKGRL